VVDLKDSGLLPGLEIAIRSMIVGETSIFLLTHQVMYGEMGIPPRIKAKASCVFYIKLLKCIITEKDG
jgi:FKBP-type peptidyl-prolyl cis-trans isomerase